MRGDINVATQCGNIHVPEISLGQRLSSRELALPTVGTQVWRHPLLSDYNVQGPLPTEASTCGAPLAANNDARWPVGHRSSACTLQGAPQAEGLR